VRVLKTKNATDIIDLRFAGTNTGDQDLSALALKLNVLELNNTIPFTPDADYEPATKKYVDDNSHRYVLYAKSESATILISGEAIIFEVTLPAGFFAAGGCQLRWSVVGLAHISIVTRNFTSRLYVNSTEDEDAQIVVHFTLQLSGTVTAGWFGGVVVERVGDTS
jgi:hypothetical protein